MYTNTLLVAAFVALAAAAPATKRATFTVGLTFRTSSPISDGGNPGTFETRTADLNTLTNLNQIPTSEIKIDSVSGGLDLASVECRAYRDADGTMPGSAPFTHAQPAEVSTNLNEEGSVLCYILTEAEASS